MKPASPLPQSRVSGVALALLAVLFLLLRIPLLSQSLWYDEMYTLLHYVGGGWGDVVGAGAYAPNNHVLHTLLAKLSCELGWMLGLGGDAVLGADAAGIRSVAEPTLRLPALLAGTAAAFALAWTVRRQPAASAPSDATHEMPNASFWLLALAAGLHPWLISMSGEARGYTLVLLLAGVSTALLRQAVHSDPSVPAGKFRWIAYGLAVALMLYTVPTAVLLVAAQGVALLMLARRAIPRWLMVAGMGLALAGIAYFPMWDAMLHYARQPHAAAMGQAEFLRQSLAFSLTGTASDGWRWPLAALGLLAVGSVAAWREHALRWPLLTFGSATVFAWLAPLLQPATGEPRFVLWLIAWQAVAMAGVGTWVFRGQRPQGASPGTKSSPRRVAVLTALLLWSSWGTWQVLSVPQQPMREGLLAAEALCPKDRSWVLGVYMGSSESLTLYGRNTAILKHPFAMAYDVAMWERLQQRAGPPAAVVVFYPEYLKRNAPDLAADLATHYRLRQQLPGRVSEVQVWEPRP